MMNSEHWIDLQSGMLRSWTIAFNGMKSVDLIILIPQ